MSTIANSRLGLRQSNVVVRRLSTADSIDELTSLLHAAYRRLGDLGLNYTAVDQPPEVTRERIARGECLVAVADGQLVGTIVFYQATAASGCPWYDRPDVASLGQFGVLPSHQSTGIGRQLLDAVERRAAESGAVEVALDTAEDAAHLVSWYERCGYRIVEHAQWDGKTYRSVIMTKALVDPSANNAETEGNCPIQVKGTAS